MNSTATATKRIDAVRATLAKAYAKSATSVGFGPWLDRFLDEKEIDLDETFEVECEGSIFGTNIMSYGTVVEALKQASDEDKAKARQMFVRIDFKNGDVRHFIRHLAQAIAI